jgi:hypothetical protein
VPARTPPPGGGSVAAIAGSLAAGLTATAARPAPGEWPRRAEDVGRAEELRARVQPLADADAEAYGAFVAERTEESLERIVAVPFELAEVAAAESVGARLVGINARPATSGSPRRARLRRGPPAAQRQPTASRTSRSPRAAPRRASTRATRAGGDRS